MKQSFAKSVSVIALAAFAAIPAHAQESLNGTDLCITDRFNTAITEAEQKAQDIHRQSLAAQNNPAFGNYNTTARPERPNTFWREPAANEIVSFRQFVTQQTEDEIIDALESGESDGTNLGYTLTTTWRTTPDITGITESCMIANDGLRPSGQRLGLILMDRGQFENTFALR